MMNKRDAYKPLIALVCYQMLGTKPCDFDVSALNGDDIEVLYKISNKLDFAHIVYSSLKQLNVPMDEEIEKKFKKAQNLAIYRATMIEYEQQSVISTLSTEGIPFILLKGAVIRDFYPEKVIRTSCDIDVLVKNENLLQAKTLFENLGYKIVQENSHDIPFMSPSGAKVELHFAITEEGLNKANLLLNDAWSYAEKDENGNSIFKKEFFLFHHFAHMAFHFKNGGCGLKPLVDLYVIEQQMGITMQDIRDLLEKSGLYKFALEMTDLSHAMFEDKLDDFHLTLLSYIIEGGAYGRIDNKVALGKTRSGGTFKYLVKRFFLPYKEMKTCYPVLEKLPFLLPVFWIIRIFHRLFSKDRTKFAAELSHSATISKDKLDETKEIQNRLDL